MSLRYTVIGTSFIIVLVWTIAAVAQQNTEITRYPWDHRPGKCFVLGAGNIDQCGEKVIWPDFAETVGQVQSLLVVPDRDLLNRAAFELALGDKQFETGQYYFEAWYMANRSQLGFVDDNLLKFIESWQKSEGASSPAVVVQGLVLVGEAWRARGGGFANTVSPEAWTIFYDKLAQADALLETATSKIKRSGPWNLLKVYLAYDYRALRSKRLDVLHAAISVWPDSTMLYEIPMSRSSPKWGGSFAQMDEIARLAATNSKVRSYAAMYALVYEREFRGNQRYVLRSTDVDWSLMKRGFRDIEQSGRHPKWIWKNFAQLACQMRDRDEARTLYELNDKQERDSSSEQVVDSCRTFAYSK